MTYDSCVKTARDHGGKILAAVVVCLVGVTIPYQLAEAARLRTETVDAVDAISEKLGKRIRVVELWKAATESDRYTIRDAAADHRTHMKTHEKLNREVTDKLQKLTESIAILSAAIGRIEGWVENRK